MTIIAYSYFLRGRGMTHLQLMQMYSQNRTSLYKPHVQTNKGYTVSYCSCTLSCAPTVLVSTALSQAPWTSATWRSLSALWNRIPKLLGIACRNNHSRCSCRCQYQPPNQRAAEDCRWLPSLMNKPHGSLERCKPPANPRLSSHWWSHPKEWEQGKICSK